ncbi:phosphoribulokinase/uridine kinase [Oscillochloris trichoides DG-6]|uniref:phosphoribulokinase n=1 Tax=Oscillochloris trichoides DG-6 TaxID=765420 RepID=E1IG55_9CHLR|nr:phosphoribulokinase/uridine kinase [Oscillochloris trichoides]EFO79835.1 phosphoribulokinase/uridine kinase [Oscillochloris trichoides DG-6]
MLGIVGDSGTGKTTLTRGVARILGQNGVTPICLDDYHRFNRAERLARGLAGADPAANDLSLMASHLETLRAGGSIQKPVYDHHSGILRDPETVAATGLVIVYGMLTLTPPDLAQLFDLTVYLDPDDALHQHWRFQRDTTERGYAPEQVLAFQDTNDRAARRYVSGQRRHTNLVVRFHLADGYARFPKESVQNLEILIRQTDHVAAIASFLDQIDQQAITGTRLDRGIIDADGRTSDRLLIDAGIKQDACQQMIELIWPPHLGVPHLPFSVPETGPSTPTFNPGLTLLPILVASILAQRP